MDPSYKKDLELLNDVKKQVESLPNDKQLLVGTEIQRAALAKIKTKAMRQRWLTSLGDLYGAQENLDEALDFYLQAIRVNPDNGLAVYCARKAVAIYTRQGNQSAAADLLDRMNETAENGKEEFSGGLVADQITNLLAKDDFAKATELCLNLSVRSADRSFFPPA